MSEWMELYLVGLLHEEGLVPEVIFFLLQNAGHLLGVKSLSDELVVFFIVLLAPFGQQLYFGVLFLPVPYSDHRSYIIIAACRRTGSRSLGCN